MHSCQSSAPQSATHSFLLLLFLLAMHWQLAEMGISVIDTTKCRISPLCFFFFCSPCRASAASDLPFAGWIGCFLAMALTRLAKVCMGVCECVCMGVCVCVCTCEGFHFSLSLSLFDLLSCSAFNLRVYVFGADALQHLSWYGLAHARKLPKMTRYLARRIKVAAQRNQQTYDLSLSNSILFSTLCAPPPNLCFACLRFIVAITSPLPCTFTFSLCLKAT